MNLFPFLEHLWGHREIFAGVIYILVDEHLVFVVVGVLDFVIEEKWGCWTLMYAVQGTMEKGANVCPVFVICPVFRSVYGTLLLVYKGMLYVCLS